MITYLLILVLFILSILIIKYIIHKRNKDKYLKAGKKWEGIVKELSSRK